MKVQMSQEVLGSWESATYSVVNWFLDRNRYPTVTVVGVDCIYRRRDISAIYACHSESKCCASRG